MEKIALDDVVERLRAAGEVTRARVLVLLSRGELSVGELAQILGQSQPRLSRHMKYLTTAGLVERMPEGAWVFYRLTPDGPGRMLCDTILGLGDLEDPVIQRDAARLEEVRTARRNEAQTFFENAAQEWDAIRALHYPEADIEAAVIEAAGEGPFDRVVDIGTGTGRMLTLFSARADRVEGIDLSHQMLTVARANLAAAGITNAAIRHGDATAAPLADGSADLVLIHQVLHFLEEPARAIQEAARILAPGGRLVAVDFAPHDLEYLRTEQSHRHLGVSETYFADWCRRAGLTLGPIKRFSEPEGGLAVNIWTADAPPTGTNKSAEATQASNRKVSV